MTQWTRLFIVQPGTANIYGHKMPGKMGWRPQRSLKANPDGPHHFSLPPMIGLIMQWGDRSGGEDYILKPVGEWNCGKASRSF